jgi:hypothetical protein
VREIRGGGGAEPPTGGYKARAEIALGRRGDKRASAKVDGRIRILECRFEVLRGLDRRWAGGADEREEVVPAYRKRIDTAHTFLSDVYAPCQTNDVKQGACYEGR